MELNLFPIIALISAVVIIFLVIKFLKIWWLKSILLGGIIGFVVLTIPIGALLGWLSCKNVPDCGLAQMYIGAMLSPIIGAVVGFFIGKRKQNSSK